MMKAKSKLTTIIAIVLLIASSTLVTMPIQAQTNLQEGGSLPLPAGVTPDVSVDTFAQLSFRPNPVGVGQTILINLWLTPAIHASRYFKDFTLTIQKPDGKEEVIKMNSYRADGTAWLEWVVDQIGEWKLKFDWPGGYFPPGNYTTAAGAAFGGGVTSFPQSSYYKPSTSGWRTLTVQQDPVLPWPEDTMPTDYWERPVHVENRQWWSMAGNWPGTGYSGVGMPLWDELYPNTNPTDGPRRRFTPWVDGPESCHILWKRKDAIAGIIGGQPGVYGVSSAPPTPSIIYQGMVYGTYTKRGEGRTTASTFWQCYDLRTGQVLWETNVTSPLSTGILPNIIEYTAPTQSEVPGAEAAGTWSVNLIRIASGYLYKWNPWTGALSANISISPLSSATFIQQPTKRGEYPLALSIQDMGAAQGANRYRLIKWRTAGTSTNFTSRIESNTTYARSSLPSYYDLNTGLGATVSGITIAGVYLGMNLTGYDLWTGQTLWSKNISEPVYSGVCDIVDHGKLAVLSDRGYYVCFDLRTGNQVWKSDQMSYPWASTGFGAYSAMSAYGMLYREAYDGVYAFNWTNGKLVWKYSAPAYSPFETPYTDENFTAVMPFYSFGVGGIIADGKFFTWNYEHTESWPVTRGWSLHAIDCLTGKGVWNITGCTTPRAVADGYLIGTNQYDGYTYIFGKGKSATTVTAGPKTIALGEKVVIEGTVMDMSPAQPNTPCVSEVSMKTQMDYLHMQMPIGGLYGKDTMTGVQVTLTAIDANGNTQNIGTVTTNPYYGTFSCEWTPPIEGMYTVMATFAGDASYSSSGAATSFTVGPPPTTAPTPIPPEKPVDYTPMMYALLAVGIIAIILMLVLLFKKRA